jgi:hypothetical protein
MSWELGFGTVAGLTVAVPTGNPTNASRGATAAHAPPSTVPLASPSSSAQELPSSPTRVPSIYDLATVMSPLVSASPPSQTLPLATPLAIATHAGKTTEASHGTPNLTAPTPAPCGHLPSSPA